MESYRSSLQKRKAQLLTEGEELEQNTRAYQADRQKDLTDQEAAAARLQEISTDMQTCRQERAALLQEISETSKQLDDMRIRVSQLTARKKTIEEMEHNYEGYNGAVRYIMKAAPTGIEGVVGDLMKARPVMRLRWRPRSAARCRTSSAVKTRTQKRQSACSKRTKPVV